MVNLVINVVQMGGFTMRIGTDYVQKKGLQEKGYLLVSGKEMKG